MVGRGGIYGDMHGDGQSVHPADDDCEDQGMASTKTCIKVECQWWEGNDRKQPSLVKRGRYWCCPNCGSSYGESPHPDLK